MAKRLLKNHTNRHPEEVLEQLLKSIFFLSQAEKHKVNRALSLSPITQYRSEWMLHELTWDASFLASHSKECTALLQHLTKNYNYQCNIDWVEENNVITFNTLKGEGGFNIFLQDRKQAHE